MQVKLSQILNSLESGGRPKGGASLDSKGVPSLGAEHLDGHGGFNFKAVKYIPEDYFNGLKNGIIEKENILIVKDGATTGKVSFVNDDFPFDKASVNEHVFLLKIDKSKAYPRFVFHYLKSPQGQRGIMRDYRGATVGGISRGFVDFVKFELPPLPAQLHIANVLSKAENLIAQRKESIRLLDEFLKSTFLEMFGDLENDTPLKSFCFFSQGIQVPVEEQYSECKDGQVRFLRIIDFTQSDEPRYINNLGERYFVSEDDISMVRYGASAGFVGYGKKGIIANNLFKFNFDKKKVLPVYLVQVLQSQRFKNYIKLKSTGSAMPALSFGMLNDYKIAVPPIELQTQFAQIVKKTEALKTQYKQSLQELENLYGSLSHKAFRGELMV
jgi:type I restriction enzyme S subunit